MNVAGFEEECSVNRLRFISANVLYRGSDLCLEAPVGWPLAK